MALSPARNSLIALLDEGLRQEFESRLDVFDFDLGHVFSAPGDLVKYIYFVDSGVISAVSLMDTGQTVEAYMVGREGFTGATAWLIPFRSPVRYVAQMTGSARRIDAARFREFANGNLRLREIMAAYDAALHAELAQSGPCNIVHRTDQRLAKWLLRAHDRADSDTLHMTQEFVGAMLGVQRTTVNLIAQTLASTGAIQYLRGKIVVKSRARLERLACECYDAGKSVADRRQTQNPDLAPV
jgi:CRP-like cAMP-binding protein